MNEWIKLTTDQLNRLNILSANNPTNDFITPIIDANGAFWLSCSILTEINGIFRYYNQLMREFIATEELPIWPQYDS